MVAPHTGFRRVVDVRPGELGLLLLAAGYGFFLLCSYYLLRPLRDAWGLEGGTDRLPWLFTGTFLAMLLTNPLYSAVVARGRRRRIVPVVYRFFALNLLVFYWLLLRGTSSTEVGYAFFIWLSVYNLFVVAIFWSVMTDLFDHEQGARLFAFIALGCSAGAIAGPLLTRLLARDLGQASLILLAVVLLEVCTQCVGRLLRRDARQRAGGATAPADAAGAAARGPVEDEVRVGGSILGGMRRVTSDPYLLGIAGQILCLTTTATFLYLLKARIVSGAVQGTVERTAVFAGIDLTVNTLEFALQLFVTAPFIRWAGLAGALRALPVLTGLGALLLAAQPTVLVLQLVEGIRRAVQYAVYRPARELLLTVVDRESKYKSRGFIDTVVYRGGDWASAQLYAGLELLGLKTAGLALAGLPVVAGWYWLCGRLARQQSHLAHESSAPRLPVTKGPQP
ncbi:MAG: NTP/NDP exchange transporter [Planctomycetota bacterium]